MRYYKLQELCTNIIDCPHSTPEWKNEGLRVVRNFNLKNGILDFTDGYFVDEATYIERTRRAIPEEGDIIISREAPMGVVGIIPKGLKCCLGQRLVLLKVNREKCDPQYLLNALMSEFVQTQFRRADATGSIVSNLCIPDLKEIIIPVVENGQREIAHLLEVISRKLALNNAINDNLAQQLRLLYDYWFTQFDFPDENGKPYRSSGGQMVWNDDAKQDIPIDWSYAKISDAIEGIRTGLNPRDNFKLGNGTIKYITVKNLRSDGILDFSGCDTIDEAARAIVHRRSDVCPGDILFASIAPLGRCHLVQEPPQDWDINESVFSIRCNKATVTPEYLYMHLQGEAFVKKSTACSTGSVFKGIRINTLLDSRMLLPSMQVVEKFSKQTKPLFSLQHKLNKEIQALTQIRDWLLPMLMNGQATISD